MEFESAGRKLESARVILERIQEKEQE
jgi:hypothetical protein